MTRLAFYKAGIVMKSLALTDLQDQHDHITRTIAQLTNESGEIATITRNYLNCINGDAEPAVWNQVTPAIVKRGEMHDTSEMFEWKMVKKVWWKVCGDVERVKEDVEFLTAKRDGMVGERDARYAVDVVYFGRERDAGVLDETWNATPRPVMAKTARTDSAYSSVDDVDDTKLAACRETHAVKWKELKAVYKTYNRYSRKICEMKNEVGERNATGAEMWISVVAEKIEMRGDGGCKDVSDWSVMNERVEELQAEIDAAAKVVRNLKKVGLRLVMDRAELEDALEVSMELKCESDVA